MRAVSLRGKGYLNLCNQWIFRVACLLETSCVDPALHPVLVEGEGPRLRKITGYIEKRSSQAIDLAGLAAFASLSPQYLSRYFSGHMGVTLTKYIASIRARNSLELLESGRMSVTDIGLECGFPNLKAYYAAFRENYGATPGEYRDRIRAETGKGFRPPQPREAQPGAFNYFAIDPGSSLAALDAFLETSERREFRTASGTRHVSLDISKPAGPFPRGEARLMAFGRAAEWRRPGWQEQFRAIQREIGFDLARFHGIFCDEMLVVKRGRDGTLVFNFDEVDGLFDFLLESGVRPFVELGFMPSALAGSDRTLFEWKANISPPSSLAEWVALVSAFFRHLLGRYGRGELRSWRFEIWNEPDMEGVFWAGTKEEFFEFFAATFEAAKSTDAGLSVGGCGFTHWNILSGCWLDAFADFCLHRGLKPDFLSCHIYPLDIESTGPASAWVEEAARQGRAPQLQGDGWSVRRSGPGGVAAAIDAVKTRLACLGLSGLPLYITEWNSSPLFGETSHDTAFMGPFVARNLVECAGRTAGMAWWVFTDIFEESGIREAEFHGGFGLVTRHGIRKPAWHAHRMYAKLSGGAGTLSLGSGEGWAASLDSGGVLRILAWNYRHYREATAAPVAPGLTGDSYDAFDPGADISFDFRIEGLSGDFEARRARVGRSRGSAFDEWLRMGSPRVLDEELLRALDHASEPSLALSTATARSSLTLRETLAPHDLVLIEISPSLKRTESQILE